MQTYGVLDGLDQFVGIVAYAVFENNFYVADVGDFRGGVALDDDQVRLFIGRDGAGAGVGFQPFRAVQGGDLDGFDGGEFGFNQEFQVAEIAEPGHGAAVAGGVDAGHQ